MNVRIRPSRVRGKVRAPPSKSYSHRAILAGGLSTEVDILGPLLSADTKATMRAVSAFGADITQESGNLKITGCRGSPETPATIIDCANSGTTMRLVMGTASLVDGTTALTGDASLRERPQGPLLEALTSLGAKALSTRGTGQAPIIIGGPIDGGHVAIPGDVSSQYISSLLMVGALTKNGIEIELTSSLKSAPYVAITQEVLDAFAITTERTANGFRVSGNQRYSRDEPYAVPGDFSSISYLAAAGAVVGEDDVTISGAYPSAQGDTAIIDILQSMGAPVDWDTSSGTLTVGQASLNGITVDVGDTPDLLPTIATLGAIADGITTIENCEHVRLKETDRVAAMATELEKMGVKVEEQPETLTIYGGDSSFHGASVEGYLDHRIIMALSIAALVANGETVIHGAEHVDVSFPSFFTVLDTIGAEVQEIPKT